MEVTNKKKTLSKKSIVLLTLLFTFFLLIGGLFVALYRGIHIQEFQVANLNFKGLYLKLDNKFILTLNQLQISQPSTKTPSNISIQDAIKWFHRSLVAMSYFKLLEIRNIILPDQQQASILYDGKRYELLFPSVVARFQLTQTSNNVRLAIQKLFFEKLQINTVGKFEFLLDKNQLNFALISNSTHPLMSPEEKLVIKGSSDLNVLHLSAFSTLIHTLAPFENQIKKIPALHKWLMQKASFKNIRVENLFFSAPLNDSFLPKLLKSLYAKLTLEDVSLTLESQIPPITTPHLTTQFKDGTLSFFLTSPLYDGVSIEGSHVELKHFDKNLTTLVHIKSQDATLDPKLHALLRAYDIDFNVSQVDSKMQTDLLLSFEDTEEKLNISAKGNFRAKDANFDLFGFPIFANSLNVVLDLTPTHSHIFVNDSKISFQEPQFEGLINCDINLEKKQVKGKANLDSFQIKTQDSSSPFGEIFSIDKQIFPQLSFFVDFISTPKITLPDFQTQITLGESTDILLSNLSKISPYSNLLKYLGISQGEVALQSKDFKTIFLQTQLSDLKYPIFDKKWQPITELNMTFKITPNRLYASSLDESMIFDLQEDLLKIQFENKNFDLDAFSKSAIPLLAQTTQTTQTTQKAPTPKKEKSNFHLYMIAKDSQVNFKDFKIPADEVIVNMQNHGIKIDFTHKNGVANIDLYDNIVKFNADNFSGNFINTIAQKSVVDGGLFSARGIYKDKVMRGEVQMQNTIFKNFATLQNVIALIDTIPSLIVFKKPGLGANGYEVNHGRITFDFNDEFLGLKKIDLVGSSIDVEGSGLINLSTKELDIALSISTIKALSEVLSKIPIVGYLLLGKEGKISTGVVIKGTLQDPKSEVSVAQDILSAPFKIIQRIFTGE